MAARPPDPEEEGLTDAEIEAILEQEGHLPPDAEHQPAPVDLVRREPGKDRFGIVIVILTIAFILLSVVQTIR